MTDKIDINFNMFDENHYVVIVKRNKVNLFLNFGLCSFEEEMEHWDMPTKLVNYKGEEGFLFKKSINKEEVRDEIERFAKHNDI